MFPIPIPLETNKFVYNNTEESILCIDQIRQYYFMMTKDELAWCKTTDTSSYTVYMQTRTPFDV
jgi:hypothetical protein